MSSPKYIELHARSAFSFLRGACIPEEYATIAASHNTSAMALTDVDGVYGSARFHMSAKKAGVQAHVGAEITAKDGGRYTLLVRSRTGYQNLSRLITRMKLRAGTKNPKPGNEAAATLDDFNEFAEGLLCLTGGDEGPLALALKNGNAPETLARLTGAFGPGNVYIELQRHLDREEEARNQAAIDLALTLKLPVVATNGVCHATKLQREVLDVFTCLFHKTTLAQAGRLLARNSERHLKSPAEMAELFADIPEAIANTELISARLGFTLSDLGYQFPEYPLPPGETVSSYLWKLTDEGASRRYQSYYDRARQQVERELKLIDKLGLGGYFLIVWDLVRFAREQGILVQGRGSAANSAVCYSLGITAVDPVAMELLFERFLSEERGEWPDIDLDLPSGDQRERVIQYVYQRYGKHGAAMTANVITYRGRSAARDIGKALGFPPEELEKRSSLVARWGWRDPSDTAEKQFQLAGYDLSHARIRTFLSLYTAAQNLPRHLGQHSGGMVICQGQLDRIVPLEPATMPGRVVIEWDKEDCADLGLVKVDLLGLGMMAVLEESLELIREHEQRDVDLAHLPQDDPAVYAALQRADTIGMFQVESRAQMSCLPRLKPKKFYDIVVQVAIIRPGPIVGKMLHPYLNRRQGFEDAACLHPSLETVLKRTLGVPLFQEQLLRIAMIAANFTGGEAEELRRAMGFKRSEARMRDIETRLRSGMTTNGIVGETQDRIVQSITSFALYGFPESHAASFALIAYASAYLKCHYLAAFTAAILNQQPMGFYHPATLVKDAQRHGLHFLPVDVMKSSWNCTIENGAVRLGFNYIRGLRKEPAEAIATARPFSSIDDLTRRVPDVRKDELRMLAEIGALNGLVKHRRDALWQSERAIRFAGPLLESLEPAQEISPLAMMTAPERIRADFYGTGVTIGIHPMKLYREGLRSSGVLAAADLKNARHNQIVRIAGCVICRQRPGTANGFMFLSIEDETGIANAIVEPEKFDQYREALVRAPYLLVEGILQNQQGAISVKLRDVQPLKFNVSAVPSHDFS